LYFRYYILLSNLSVYSPWLSTELACVAAAADVDPTDKDEDDDAVDAVADADEMAAVATPWCRRVSRSCFFSEHMVGAIFLSLLLFGSVYSHWKQMKVEAQIN